jgi:hypothetical protein
MTYIRETVAIRKSDGRRSVIAKSDFDPKTMELWDAPQSDPQRTEDDKPTRRGRRDK